MLDLVMSTMSTFTAKLNAMEARLTGLSSRVEDTPLQSKKRKSRSRDKTKCIEISDEEEDVNLQTVTSHPIVTLEDGTRYTQVFPDTAVMSKITATPARAKKSKQDIYLGVAPLQVPAARTWTEYMNTVLKHFHVQQQQLAGRHQVLQHQCGQVQLLNLHQL